MSHIRSQNLRIFLHWLRANRHRFNIQPGPIIFRRRTSLGFTFIGITDAIRCHIGPLGLVVYAEWHSETWDLIAEFDLSEDHSVRGWHCGMCLPEAQAIYQSREALWTEHCFETFLEWCNEKLAPARWLELYRSGGATAATLHNEMPDNNRHWLSLECLLDNLVPLGGKPDKKDQAARENETFFLPVRNRDAESELKYVLSRYE